VRFWLGAWFELPAYAIREKRPALLARTLISEVMYWSAVVALWRVNWLGCLWTLLIPFALSTLLLMFGNW
jgi:hypothetical protein